MSDITLILDRRDLKVTLEDETVRIERTALEKFERIPINMIEKLIVTGNPLISCDIWQKLAERNIPVLIFSRKNGKSPAYFTGGISGNVHLRVTQHMSFQNKKLQLTIARWLLDEKLEGQECLLRSLSNDERILAICDLIKDRRMNLNKMICTNKLMGQEGVAASLYFQALSKFIPGKWGFNGRNKRPPKDPVNALLSYTYVIAGSKVLRAIFEKGLDPSVSFLHAIHTNRENLVFDLMEPLRPALDRFVLFLIDNVLSENDFFQKGKNGCFLNKTGRKLYFDQWYKWHEPEEGDNLTDFIDDIVNDLIGFFPESLDHTNDRNFDVPKKLIDDEIPF
ncbi:CRISPR-associated protein Cas1 [Candidatus Magnetomorum sp. HK-1]|nr:CRISPR-associated protein Cas1 [Candidatus Magnetomorum sp. HK-1]